MNEQSFLENLIPLVAQPGSIVGLHQRLHDEIGRVLAALDSEGIGANGSALEDQELRRRIERYEELVSPLAEALAIIAAFGTADAPSIAAGVLERLAEVAEANTNGGWASLVRYPALAAFYAAGVSGVAHKRFDVVVGLCQEPVLIDGRRRERPTEVFTPPAVLDPRIATKLPGLERHKTPLNDRLFEVVRPWVRLPVPSDRRYERGFDEWEYLIALVEIDAGRGWAPIGRWGWKQAGDLDPGAQFAAAVKESGSNAPLLAAGLLGGSAERFDKARTSLGELVARSGIAW
jgi:hypothetical protein